MLQALQAEQQRRLSEDAPAEVVSDTEAAMVAMFTDACRFDMQCGYTELAIALIQAQLEYTCYPAIPAAGRHSNTARQQ